jgi:hypothetical protein
MNSNFTLGEMIQFFQVKKLKQAQYSQCLVELNYGLAISLPPLQAKGDDPQGFSVVTLGGSSRLLLNSQ